MSITDHDPPPYDEPNIPEAHEPRSDADSEPGSQRDRGEKVLGMVSNSSLDFNVLSFILKGSDLQQGLLQGVDREFQQATTASAKSFGRLTDHYLNSHGFDVDSRELIHGCYITFAVQEEFAFALESGMPWLPRQQGMFIFTLLEADMVPQSCESGSCETHK